MRSSRQPVALLKAVPWALIARAVMVVGTRWTALSAKDRSRLSSLVRDSHGRFGKLTSRERNELRTLVGKLDLTGAVRELMLLRGRKRRRKRR